MKNNLENIYQTFGENICLFPYMAGFYSLVEPSFVMPCSVVKVQGWELQGQTILSSMNSPQWIELRKNFIQGSCHTTEFCGTCSVAEKNGGDSARKLNNQYFAEHISTNIIEYVSEIANNDFKITKVLNIDFCPSNYCNYECVMCFSGSSTKRATFELKMFGTKPLKYKDNISDDFYQLLETVEILNFTGGETLLQNQVHEVIDYLIEKNLAKNIIISLLTNVSKYPKLLEEKFKKFKDVFYTLSIDGVGEVIEYQRRGSKWPDVESNSLHLWKNYGCVVNYVVTAINVFSFDKFLSWAYTNKIDKIIISLVFDRNRNLSMAVIPLELRDVLIKKLQQEKSNYVDLRYVDLLDQIINIFDKMPYDSSLLPAFKKQIQIEDSVSKKSLVEVVPEWEPYFND